MARQPFPADFLWGTATSSYQIEGAWNADGKGESIWDRFAHTPGKIEDGSTGDIACDHYHRWPQDIELMRLLGAKAYRFSTAWTRILPDGTGQINQAGLDFYSQLVDALLEAGIEPFLTLYHWDLPQALQEKGGWTNRSTAAAFAEFAGVVSRHLGDRVKHWMTLNEPYCAAYLGHELGTDAPGVQDMSAAIMASHHLLLAHGLAVPAIRGGSQGSEVGIALNHEFAEPASASAADLKATRLYDGYYSRWFLDPIYGRDYPADMVRHYESQGFLENGLDFVQPGDLESIAVPLDFQGLNYYTRIIIRDETAGENLPPSVVRRLPLTEMGWEVHPQGLYHFLNRLYYEYRPKKIFITENGCSWNDVVDVDGRVRDQQRIDYLTDHFEVARQAIDSGIPLAGYFVWTLMDNFEWSSGFTQQFGLAYLDQKTLRRIPKESLYWYRDFIRNRGLKS